MDTPTHAIIGRLAARVIWPQRKDNILVNLATICSIIPDLDVFIPGDALESLVTHRGFSHSIVGAIVGSGLVAAITSRIVAKDRSIKQLFVACFIGWAFHILFDVLTSYGTVVFSPFSNARVSLDTLFILDPLLDLIVIGGLLLGWLTRLKERAYRGAGALVCLYVFASAGITIHASDAAKTWASEQKVTIDNLVVMPTPFSPLHRRAFITSQESVHLISMSLGAGIDEEVTVFQSALSDPKLKEVWQTRAGNIYRWFARVPIVEHEADKVFVSDLQFMQRNQGLGWMGEKVAAMMLERNPKAFESRMFYLEIETSKTGQLGAIKFSKRQAD